MAHRTRRSQSQLPNPFEDPERMTRPRQTVVAPPTSVGTDRPTGREENTLEREEMMTPLLEEASVKNDSE